MIISDQYKYLYISNPKTGTHTMYYYLPRLYKGERYGGYHERDLPKNINDYVVFTTLRHPFERLVSAWHSCFTKERERDIFLKLVPGGKFTSFVDFILDHDNKSVFDTERAGPVLTLQTTWLGKNLDRIDQFILTEHMDKDFASLDFTSGEDILSPKLKRNHAGWPEMFEKLSINKIYQLADWLEPDTQLWENVLIENHLRV